MQRFAFRTINGNYLTAATGGGWGGQSNVPLNTDATAVGAWELFTLVTIDAAAGQYALMTSSGNFVTAVNGGGIGGPNDGSSPIHSDATIASTDERFYLTDQGGGQVSVRTYDGHYLTAVNGGGMNNGNGQPVHTDASNIGPWETFTAENLSIDPAACAGWHVELSNLQQQMHAAQQEPPSADRTRKIAALRRQLQTVETRIDLDC